MIFIKITSFYCMIFPYCMHDWFAIHSKVGFPDHKPFCVVFPADLSASVHICCLNSTQIIHDSYNLFFPVIFIPYFVISVIATDRVSVFIIIRFSAKIPCRIILKIHLTILVTLDGHGYSVFIIPFLVDNLFLRVEHSSDLGITICILSPFSVRTIIYYNAGIPEFIQRSLLMRVSGFYSNFLVVRTVICCFQHSILHLIDALNRSISTDTEYRQPVCSEVSFFCFISILIVPLPDDCISVLTAGQFALQVLVSDANDLAFFVIDVLNCTDSAQIRHGIIIFVQISRTDNTPVFIQLAEPCNISVYGYRLILRVELNHGITDSVFIIFCSLISISFSGCENQFAFFIIVALCRNLSV